MGYIWDMEFGKASKRTVPFSNRKGSLMCGGASGAGDRGFGITYIGLIVENEFFRGESIQ